ncbi:MAG: DinB family protein [Bryobacteraceae bacterium]|nr:DinB family protein [Bryobacteraceae bacterium]
MISIRDEIETAVQDADRLTAALNDRQLAWQPAPGSWSIAQNLEHLTITAQRMMEAMDAGCAKGSREGPGSKPWQPSIFARWFLRILEPPAKMKVKTPAAFDPAPGRPLHTLMPEFRSTHRALTEKLAEYAQYDQNRTRVVSPFQSAIRYKLGTALAIIPAHLRRHLDQMRQIRNHAGFPAS